MSPLNPRGICRIAVVRSNHRLGNTLLLLPLLSVLEEAFPGAEIDLITGGQAATPLFREYRQVTSVHSFPVRSYTSPARVLRLLGSLRTQRYDLAIDPTPKSRSGRFLLAWLQARHRLGYRWASDLRNTALTHAVPADGIPPHLAHAGVHLLQRVLAGAPGVPAAVPPMDLRLTPAELEHGRARLLRLASPGAGPTVALFGAATGRKTYSPAWWFVFLRRFAALEPTARLIEVVPHDGRPRFGGEFPAYYSLQPREMAAVCRATDLFVSADCGVMHLASAARARVLGLFKVSDAVRYAPYGNGSTSLEARDNAPVAAAEHASSLLRAAPSGAP
jgi:ADP-heptose:LPS heptosyltransferase